MAAPESSHPVGFTADITAAPVVMVGQTNVYHQASVDGWVPVEAISAIDISDLYAVKPKRWKAGRAQRRRCGRAGHLWKPYEDGAIACVECGEER